MPIEKPKLKGLSPQEVAEAKIRFAFSGFPELHGAENHELIKKYAKAAVEAISPLMIVDPNAKLKEERSVIILSNFENSHLDAVYATVLDTLGRRITPKAIQISGFNDTDADKKTEQKNYRKLHALQKGKPLPMCVWSKHKSTDSDNCIETLFESFTRVNEETPYGYKVISISYSRPVSKHPNPAPGAALTLTLKIPVGKFLPIYVLSDLSYSSDLLFRLTHRQERYDQTEYSLRDLDSKGWPKTSRPLNLLKNFSSSQPVLFNILDHYAKYLANETLSRPQLFGGNNDLHKPDKLIPFVDTINFNRNPNGIREGYPDGIPEDYQLPGGEFKVAGDNGWSSRRTFEICREDKCSTRMGYINQFYSICHGESLQQVNIDPALEKNTQKPESEK